jgi:hypothetical protein
MEIYASCSILPSRVENVKTLVTMLSQYPEIKKIYIHYPERCIRLNIDYPPVPDWMEKNDRVIVNRSPDWGPMTKFAFMLDIFPTNANVGLLLLDDDTKYPDKWFRSLIDCFSENPQHAYGRHGSLSRKEPFKFTTYNTNETNLSFRNASTRWGAIYPRSMFPATSILLREKFTQYTQDGIFSNDDIILGSTVYTSGISLYLVPTSEIEIDSFLKDNQEGDDDMALSRTTNSTLKQINLVSKLILNGDYPSPWPEIAVITGVIVSILIFFIVCLVFIKRS